jgi:hypothetical protein
MGLKLMRRWRRPDGKLDNIVDFVHDIFPYESALTASVRKRAGRKVVRTADPAIGTGRGLLKTGGSNVACP